MWNSIYYLPNELARFWGAGIGIKIQVLLLLFLLYLVGYYSSKLLVNRRIWKWGLFLFLALPFLVQIYASKQIIFIFPVALGLCKGLFMGNTGFNPLGAFEGIMDVILSIRQRRGQEEIHRMHAEAEDVLRNAKKHAKGQRYQQQNRKHAGSDKERFREEMKRNRDRQEQEAKGKSQAKQKSTSEKPKSQPAQLDPTNLADAYEILGVPYDASLPECKKARLTLLAMYHPDKVAHLNETRRKLAEDEAKRINGSWERVKTHLQS